MGTVPTSKIEADLNGTGVLVDITDYVDEAAGIGYTWGRTDWSAPEPAPGQLTFTLDNTDGRFTPGNTDTYAVGVVDGVTVKWTCGSRKILFTTGTPVLTFPNGSSNSSQVQVSCYDAVGKAARRTLRTMLDEEVLASDPAVYWRLDDSGTGLAVHPQDSSGNAAAALIPRGDASGFGWATGQGPAADSGGALYLSGDAETPSTAGAYLVSSRPVFTTDLGFTFAMWFTLSNVFRNLHLINDAVHLATFQIGAQYIGLYWTAYNGKIRVQVQGKSWPWSQEYPLSLTRTHLAVVSLSSNGTLKFYIDGKDTGAGNSTYNTTWIAGSPVAIRLGSADQSVWPGMYAHAGTVARVMVGDYSFPAGMPDDLWQVGQLGAPESVEDRLDRFTRYGLTVAYAGGTSRGDKVGRQDTQGVSLLSAICDALRTEDAAVQPDTAFFKDSIYAWLYSWQRPSTSSFTIDVEADCVGPPELSFDTSAVASTVQVSSPTVQAVWTMDDPGRWPHTSTDVSCALVSHPAAVNLAQYRALLGRLTSMIPSSVTVDAATSEHDLTSDLLSPASFYPGMRITITGMDSDIAGYSSVDVTVIGGSELHTVTTSQFQLSLQPLAGLSPLWGLYDGSTVDDAGRLGAADGNTLKAAVTASGTNIAVNEPTDSKLTTTQLPFTIKIGDEHMSVTASNGLGGLAVTRGVDGTTAAAHSKDDAVTVVGVGVLGY